MARKWPYAIEPIDNYYISLGKIDDRLPYSRVASISRLAAFILFLGAIRCIYYLLTVLMGVPRRHTTAGSPLQSIFMFSIEERKNI